MKLLFDEAAVRPHKDEDSVRRDIYKKEREKRKEASSKSRTDK